LVQIQVPRAPAVPAEAADHQATRARLAGGVRAAVAPKGLTPLQQYRDFKRRKRAGAYAAMGAKDLWYSKEMLETHRELCFIAQRILNREYSSNDVERLFSRGRYAQGTYRGSLTVRHLYLQILAVMQPDAFREIHMRKA
jgi:hypothetical protein